MLSYAEDEEENERGVSITHVNTDHCFTCRVAFFNLVLPCLHALTFAGHGIQCRVDLGDYTTGVHIVWLSFYLPFFKPCLTLSARPHICRAKDYQHAQDFHFFMKTGTNQIAPAPRLEIARSPY
jgi:hypothetical protein